MAGGNWMNNDGLYVQYGTSKAVPTTAGDYQMPGEWRDIELTITPSTLTASPAVQANTTMIPSGVFIESVNVTVDNVAPAGGTSISVGTLRADRTTVVSNTAFVNAQVLANHDAPGESNTYTQPGAGAGGGLIGTVTNFTDGFAYISALAAGTYTGAGTIKVRIRYRGIGTITQ